MSVAKRTLIVGYGNTLRRDDGIGVVAALHLFDTLPADTVTVVHCRQLMPELAESLADVDIAVFIDASAGAPPGRVAVIALERNDALPEGFTHRFEPPALLALAHQLYGRRPRAFLISVCGQSFDLGEGLSDVVTAALPQVMHEVQRLIG